MRSVITLVAIALATYPCIGAAQFSYRPPGELVGGSGTGREDYGVYAPGIRFPIRDAPAFLNSQVWGAGGSQGPGGSQCDAVNFSYPWRDNYCESRSWTMPLCPSAMGHQGQDIRGATCANGVHACVAVTDGTISNIGSYSVYLSAADGTRFDYLHMNRVAVTNGQRVTRGQVLGYVSNQFGGTPTTVHLHFNIQQNVTGVGRVYVPPYLSLIQAYEELIGTSRPIYRAEFVAQSFPFARDPFVVPAGTEVSGYIELRNTGTVAWTPGLTHLGTTEPRDVSSALAGSDWIAANRPATVDRPVSPGEVGRFAFSVRAPLAPGDYPQFFNLVEEGVTWFSDSGGPVDAQLQVRVTVAAYDASSPILDSGAPDSAAPGDSGSEPDAAVLDGGTAADASLDPDAALDANEALDSGALLDANAALDASALDASVLDAPDSSAPDGESSGDAGDARGRSLSGGCGCRVVVRGPSRSPIVVALLLGAGARLRRRAQRRAHR